MILADISSVVGPVIVGGILIGAVVAKFKSWGSTVCRHCGHDSGIPGSRAPVCPACGRNRTVLNPKRARKR
jgi:transposase-like protein